MATVPTDIVIPPNNKKYKEEKKQREKLDPIVNADSIKKKSLGKKFTDTFLTDDVDSLSSYIIQDMVIPTVKNFVLNALQYCFFHETGYRDYGRGDDRRYTNYSAHYGGKSYGGRDHRKEEDYRRKEPDWRTIDLNNLDDAESLVSRLRRQIEDTGDVSISQLYNLVNLPSEYTDMNWGWTSTRDIGLRRLPRGGYRLDLAEPRYLD